MKALVKIQRFNRESPAEILALPRFGLKTAVFSVGERARFRLAMAFLVIGLGAVAAYVAAVNAILLSGEAIKKETGVQKALERDVSGLQNILVRRQSPALLQSAAEFRGMVKVAEVRYIEEAQSVALSR